MTVCVKTSYVHIVRLWSCHIKILARVLLTTLMIVVLINTTVVFAIDSGFSAQELTQEEYSTFVSNIEFVLLETEPHEHL